MRGPERLGAVAAGLVLLTLALPRLSGAVAELPGRPVMEALEAGRPVGADTLERLADSARRADMPKAEAVALLRLGQPTAAAKALASGLERAPADPYGWLRLAHAEPDPERAARAFALSLRTGRWERELAADRVAVGARLLPWLRDADRAGLYEQIAWLYRLDPPRLLRALPPRAYWPLYRRALSGSPEALAVVAARVGMD